MTPQRLRLDPSARILPGQGDRLHIIHRKGAFNVRGKGLKALQQLLAPVLDGRYTRDELLASAGVHAETVDQYLRTLSQTGALVAPDADGPTHAENTEVPNLAPQPGVQTFCLSGRNFAITLEGAESMDEAATRISFASRAEVERRTLSLRVGDTAHARIWVCTDGLGSQEELTRRATITRHLLAMELGRSDSRQAVFDLSSRRLSLHRLAVAEARPNAQRDLAVQLNLVHLADKPQIPLVVMVAELVGLGRSLTGYGLNAIDVRRELTSEFLVRQSLAETDERAAVARLRGSVRGPGTCARAEVLSLAEIAKSAVIAPSPTRCIEKAIALRFWPALHSAGRTGDLLSLAPPSQRSANLQRWLLRRRTSLPAAIDDRRPPLVTVQSAYGFVARLGMEEAVTEVLLRAVANDLGFTSEELACVAPLCDATTRRLRLRTVFPQIPTSPPALVHTVHRFGRRHTLIALQQ